MPMTLSLPTRVATAMQRPVRVSFVIDNLGRAGTESQLLALLRTLDRSRVEPSLVLLNGESEVSRRLEPDDCEVLRLGVKKLVSRTGWRAAKRLREFWRVSPPDIAQLYFLDSAYFGLPVAKRCGVPKIIRVRNNLSYWLTRKHRILNRMIRPFVDCTLTNSTEGRDALMRQDGLPEDRIEVIENGVDLDRFEIPSHRPFSGPTVRIGCVANLRPVKNIDGLMRVAAGLLTTHPHLRFEVAGEGEQRGELEKLHAELGLSERFRLLGSVKNIPGFMAGLDAAVLPSHSSRPPAHASVQVPSVHVATVPGVPVHGTPQPPQFASSAPTSTSQPLLGFPSQSARPASHAKPHIPPAPQVALASAAAAQTVVQPPQVSGALRSASQPLLRSPSQSPVPATHA